jgi:hypothetical protein
MSKQDPREGFPSHEQDRHENEEDVIGSESSDDTEKLEAAEKLAHEIMADHSIFNDESLEDNQECEQAVRDILNFAKQRISELNDEITSKGDMAADQYEDHDESSFEENTLADCYSQVMIEEAKNKSVSAKKNINPWAVERALENKTGHHYNKKSREKIVKGIKMGAKKYGKKITSKAVKKK